MNLRLIVVFLVVLTILGVAFAGWYEWVVWHECLAKDSWWYCLRILG